MNFNKYLTVIAFLSTSLFQVTAVAQSSYDEQRKELLEILSTIETAVNAADIAAIKPFLRPNTVMIFQDATVAIGAQGASDYFNKMLGAGDSLLKDMTLKATVGGPAEFYGEDMAVAHGYLDAEYFFRVGKPLQLRTYWTTTVVSQDDIWTIASLHFSNNMFDNPVLNASKKLAWIVGVVALISGLFLMWLFKRVTRRSKRRRS